MSKLAGAFCLAPGTCDPGGESRVRLALEEFEGAAVRQLPSLLMGCAGSPPGEPGIAASPEGNLCAWDGWLDNREDLLLQWGRDCLADRSDAGLALTAYRQRGIAGLRDLIGDWSLAIWDGPARTVILASDYAGVRPLYYCRSAGRLLWSSSLADLVRWSDPQELDDEYVASFLTRGSAAHRTPYREIFPVPPGHAVAFSLEGVVTTWFWDLPADGEIVCADERDYEVELRRLFREAVDVRLRGGSPVCAELSGGLDSSSVVAMAHRIMGGQGAAAQGLHTFSYTHEGCTDAGYFEGMERDLGLSAIHLDLDTYRFAAPGCVGDAAPCWWEPRLTEIARRMDALGSTVFLTGQFGDFTMGNSFDDTGQVAEHLHRGQVLRAFKEAYAWSQSLQAPIYSILWRELRGDSTNLASIEALSGGVGEGARGDSLSAEFRKRTSLADPEGNRTARWKSVSPGRRRRFRALAEMLDSRLLETPPFLRRVRYSHPFAHRPLVEFMMTIPASIVCRPGEPRRLMRRAFAGLLPPPILKRQSKAGYGGIYRKALLPMVAGISQAPGEMRTVQRGYLDRASIEQRLNLFAKGLDCNETQLRPIVLFEYWLRGKE